ncbi:hypothetical protein BOTBODRAFT_145040 [Botryobasidium botryosum FD-172 SS1]|uniref:Uncharacterized protein n=1 Tax=Botryobasidium botryosum (strain FD-172 SS1) TaxID=930990 RepID=A0A067MIQ3_BOTB1|nr:hypothetical protein BOTBODRAFT_145040 [Botryobasidium botryosum FD-172 SS1]
MPSASESSLMSATAAPPSLDASKLSPQTAFNSMPNLNRPAYPLLNHRISARRKLATHQLRRTSTHGPFLDQSISRSQGVSQRAESPASEVDSEPFDYVLNDDGLPVRSVRSPTHEVDPLSVPLPLSFLSTMGLQCQEAEPCDPVSPGGANPLGAIGQGRPCSASPRQSDAELSLAFGSYFPPCDYDSPSAHSIRARTYAKPSFDPFKDWDASSTPPLSPAASSCSSGSSVSIEFSPLPSWLTSVVTLDPKSPPFIPRRAPVVARNEEPAPISMWVRVARAKAQEPLVAKTNHVDAIEVVGEHLGWNY